MLFEALSYTGKKNSNLCSIASRYRASGGNYFTEEALDVYRSNMTMAMNCSVEINSSNCYSVSEFGKIFKVQISEEGEFSCSCHRFFDEEIACQHILKVIDHTRKNVRLSALIGPIYDQSRFIRAFPDELPFIPKKLSFFCSKPKCGPPHVPRANSVHREHEELLVPENLEREIVRRIVSLSHVRLPENNAWSQYKKNQI